MLSMKESFRTSQPPGAWHLPLGSTRHILQCCSVKIASLTYEHKGCPFVFPETQKSVMHQYVVVLHEEHSNSTCIFSFVFWLDATTMQCVYTYSWARYTQKQHSVRWCAFLQCGRRDDVITSRGAMQKVPLPSLVLSVHIFTKESLHVAQGAVRVQLQTQTPNRDTTLSDASHALVK